MTATDEVTFYDPPAEVPQPEIPNGKPGPEAWHATIKAELADAEKELARDQKALEAAKAKVAALTADVAFDEMKVASRAKGVDTFERLRAKAAK